MDHTVEFKASIDMKALSQMLARAPQKTRAGTARLLNDEAFTFKELAPRVLDERYHIRNRGFVSSRFRVEKASPAQDPHAQVARSGSIYSDRFSGWVEEVTGREPERNRTVGTNARGGVESNIAAQANRLKPGLTFASPDDYDEIPERMRIPAMISILARNPDYTASGKGLFIIAGGNWVPGLYKFKKGQTATWARSKKKGLYLKDKRDNKTRKHPEVTRVQTFGEAPAPRRFNWPQQTINKVFVWFNSKKEYIRMLNDIFNSK